MTKLKIVVWDNIGNVLLGVRPWEGWSERVRERLLAADPQAATTIPTFGALFREYEIDLVWLYDPVRSRQGFRDLFAEFAPVLRDANEPGVVEEAIRAADFLVLHKESVQGEVLRRASRLRLIQHLGQDIRGIPLDVARELGVPVAAIPLVNYLVVAEHAWALILNHLKQLPQQRALMATRQAGETWGYVPNQRYAGDLALGLLGFGEIARPLAKAARAFDLRVRYWDRERFPELEARYGVEYADWEAIFRDSDIVSVHLALNPQTEGIIGAREIGLMRSDALFVNTARGKLVDQGALTAALRERQIGGAALEVFAEEPLPPDDPLYDLHADLAYNVTLTPHSSSLAPGTWLRDSQAVWFNVLRALRGEPLAHLV